ncbi:MAG: hypothetical protein KAJ86_03075 [Alphaproteobacteria bacterium]|nr:hypothetical protein [Alphaproteobacteria bacterium]
MQQQLFLIFSLVICLFLPVHAKAGEPRLLEMHDDWAAYVFIENSNKVCYIASKPKKAEGDYTQRGKIFALITHRPAEGTKNVFSYITGYNYKAGSNVNIEIDGEHFILFTQGDTGWAPDEATDNKLTQAIRKGSKMIVRGVSSRGTATKDTFSLKGSGAAHDRITKECSS